MLELYPEEISVSPYLSWFETYAGVSYATSNDAIINMADSIAKDDPSVFEDNEIERLSDRCTSYEDGKKIENIKQDIKYTIKKMHPTKYAFTFMGVKGLLDGIEDKLTNN